MTHINEFVASLRSLDIKIWAEGDRVRVNAPEGALTPALKSQLRDRKAELLAFLREVQDTTKARDETIPLVSREGQLPLSFAQERLWFLQQLEEQNSAYNMPIALRVTGRLDLAVFERSFNEILRRHEVLRTTFEVLDGEPTQHIHRT